MKNSLLFENFGSDSKYFIDHTTNLIQINFFSLQITNYKNNGFKCGISLKIMAFASDRTNKLSH